MMDEHDRVKRGSDPYPNHYKSAEEIQHDIETKADTIETLMGAYQQLFLLSATEERLFARWRLELRVIRENLLAEKYRRPIC